MAALGSRGEQESMTAADELGNGMAHHGYYVGGIGGFVQTRGEDFDSVVDAAASQNRSGWMRGEAVDNGVITLCRTWGTLSMSLGQESACAMRIP